MKLTEISKGAAEITTDRTAEKDVGFPPISERVGQPQRRKQRVVDTDRVSRRASENCLIQTTA